MSTAIEATGVIKSFGDTVALDGFDLSVAEGQVMGFLGPNGAGKSTMIRIIMGLMHADSGSVDVLGRDPWNDAVELHRQMAYVPGDVTLWPSLTGGETIDVLGRLGAGLDERRRSELVERFDFDPTKKGRAYSKGNRQKAGLIAALASNATLLVMDEPTSGLDPLMEAEFQRVVRERVADGATVLLSSHILAEVESLCDHVTIISKGKAVETGSLAQLRHLATIEVTATTAQPASGISSIDGVSDLRVDGEQVRFSTTRTALPDVVSALAPLGVTDLVSHPPTLEALFLGHYGITSADDDQG